ncbi:MAG: DHHW family protein [Eubacteriales bacterium]
MTKKTYEKLVLGGFVFCLSGLMLVNFVSADVTFSPTENRELAQSPEFSVEAMMDGSYMTSYETYLNDQFIFRDHWVALKAVVERVIGKNENNGVIFGSQDTLLVSMDTPEAELMEKNAGYVNALGEKVDIPVAVGLIPSSSQVWSGRLPNHAPTANEAQVIEEFYGQLSDNIIQVPLLEGLTSHKEEDIYYRTDHHWTSLGAYYGYETIMNALGEEATPLSHFTPRVVSDSFFGTIYSTSGVRWVKPDTMHIYVEESEDIKVTSNFVGVPEEGVLYSWDYLDVKDKYSFFLGGLQPICTIETAHTDKPSILVIRDSYSDSLAPFLTENFSEIHLLDLRFYHMGVSSYVAANEIDQVLVLYSLSNFVNEKNLFKLGM